MKEKSKILKIITAFILAAVMIFTAAPLSVLAENAELSSNVTNYNVKTADTDKNANANETDNTVLINENSTSESSDNKDSVSESEAGKDDVRNTETTDITSAKTDSTMNNSKTEDGINAADNSITDGNTAVNENTENEAVKTSNPETLQTLLNESSADKLKFTQIKIFQEGKNEAVADILNGEIPKLSKKNLYRLYVTYSIPYELKSKPTYFKVYFGNGLYVNSMDGATFDEGPIDSTGFEKLVKSPIGTGTAPYGYPGKDNEKRRSGEVIYKSKIPLDQVSTQQITFRVDEAFENESEDQILKDKMVFALGTDPENMNTDVVETEINAIDKMTYDFYVESNNEILKKGDITSTIAVSTVGDKALTKENSKTVIKITYPKDLELVSLEETNLYKKNGNIVDTVEEGENKIATVEWDEPGSYSGGLYLKPHIRVPADSKRTNGSAFTVTLKDLSKTVWEADPGRTSLNYSAKLNVRIIEGDCYEAISIVPLNEQGSNWSKKKYDTYNIRLGSMLIKNELGYKTDPKTINMDIDKNDTAIIRGITIPYREGIDYMDPDNAEKYKIRWTSAWGESGENTLRNVITPSSGTKTDVSALIKNTSLGLDINDSIKKVSIDIGSIPENYDGKIPFYDQVRDGFIEQSAPYFWSFSSVGIFGTWKKGRDSDIKDRDSDIVSDITISDTGAVNTTVPESNTKFNINWFKGSKDQHFSLTSTVKAISSPPRIVNGVGKIDKTQINGGESFKISGRIDDSNWDWNPLQEPVIYVIMPEGFSYSDLKVYKDKEGDVKLGNPEYMGHFDDRKNIRLDVWKYRIEIGEKTAGHYQPDFSDITLKLEMNVKSSNYVAKGQYYIRDFIGISTEDFGEIGAVIAAEKWDHSNWSTSQYTNTDAKDPKDSYDVFKGEINDGSAMVSLSDPRGIIILQPAAVVGKAIYRANGKVYDYSSDNIEKRTAPLKPGDKFNIHIAVANNDTNPVSKVVVYVPLLKDGLNFGNAFMPEDSNKLPLDLDTENIYKSENFEMQYVKLKNGVLLDKNRAPAKEDYKTVADSGEADMLIFTANRPVTSGNGGNLDIPFVLNDNISYNFNDKTDVISPVIFYNISDNEAALSLEPGAVKAEIEAPKFISFDITKKWTGGETPLNSVSVNILGESEGNAKKIVKTVEIKASDNWKLNVNGLPISDENNKKILYTVEEVKPEGYTAEVIGNMDDGFTITNHKNETWTDIKPGNVSVKVTKKWKGIDAKDAPEVTVKLLRDGKETDKSIILNSKNNWEGEFKELPISEKLGSSDYKYTVEEVKPEGYTAEVTGNMDEGFTITNHKNETWTDIKPGNISVKVTKKWNGIDAKDAPEVTVKLLRDGKETDKSIILNSKNNWEGEFKELPISEKLGSSDYKYTVEEVKPEGYTAEVTGNMDDGYVITNILDNDHSKDKDKHDGDNSGGGSSDTSIININKPSAGNLNITDHYAYLFGYKDWTFRPDGNMTRAEVTAMFGRLMKVYPDKNAKYSIPYSDVKDNAWYSLAVGYLNDKGLIKGYPDGTFRPDSKITRAEFAAIASRFDSLVPGGRTFYDVPATHWAIDYINSAAAKGWVHGYPDGTFRPERNITRAEVTTVTNYMLNREADKSFVDSHLKEMVVYSDVRNHWAYYDIQEATNGHDYHRVKDNREVWEELNHKAFMFCVEKRDKYFSNAGGTI